MPYKTKFREVEVPKTDEDVMALASDANSARSWGAATYREFNRENAPAWLSDKSAFLRASIDLYESIVEPRLLQENPAAIPKSERFNTYFLQGMLREARAANDTEIIEYISGKLAQRGSRKTK